MEVLVTKKKKKAYKSEPNTPRSNVSAKMKYLSKRDAKRGGNRNFDFGA